MSSKKKWAIRAGIVGLFFILLFVGVPFGVGSLMSREHQASGTATLLAPREEVWKTVIDFEGMGSWRADVGKVERLPDVDGKPSFKETRDDFNLTYTFQEVTAPRRLVVALADDKDYFGGTWTYEIIATDTGSELTITENGWAGPGFFRFMLWLFGADATIKDYLGALQKKHGGSAQ